VAVARRDLAEQAEHQQWMHHVVDLDDGRVLSTALDRPITPLSRGERLLNLGHWNGPPIFDFGSRTLSPRSPYQPSPLSWLTLYDTTIDMPDGEDLGYWSLPLDLQPSLDLPGFRAHFDAPPASRTVVTIRLSGTAWPNRAAQVRVRAFTGGPPSATVQVPLPVSPTAHQIDLAVVPTPGNPLEVIMELLPGVHTAAFTAISIEREQVIFQGP
jgi:hypothetical protein